jgi:hypothetical protein
MARAFECPTCAKQISTDFVVNNLTTGVQVWPGALKCSVDQSTGEPHEEVDMVVVEVEGSPAP